MEVKRKRNRHEPRGGVGRDAGCLRHQALAREEMRRETPAELLGLGWSVAQMAGGGGIQELLLIMLFRFR